MKKFPQRKPLRLQGYDYSHDGIYFITICVQGREEMLSKIILKNIDDTTSATIQLTEYGIVAEKYTKTLPGILNYVIMPNHIHMLIKIDSTPFPRQSISQRVSSFKNLVTKEVGFSLFQRSFHDHIIRNEKEYLQIKKYIENNAATWAQDCFFQK